MATGVAVTLYRAGVPVVITEVSQPRAIRRTVAFASAVTQTRVHVEGIEARCVTADEVRDCWHHGVVPVVVDPEAGIWQGHSVARRLVSPDGMTILVGRTAADNDLLSLKLAAPDDFWFHAAGESGSHVVVRNPNRLETLPRETKRLAAALAAGHSKARRGGRVAVHMARCREVSKRRGLAPGKVILARYDTVHAAPVRVEDVPHEE